MNEEQRERIGEKQIREATGTVASVKGECEACGNPEDLLCDDCAEDERERDLERAERLAEEDRFLYGI